MKQSSRHRSATTADADRTAPTLPAESEEAADVPAIDAASLATPDRLGSIDAYRGLVMLLMLAEVLRLSTVAASFPDSRVWQMLGHHQSHVEWVGCALHDLIQPSFTFLVGVSLPFSLASRRRRGQSLWRMAVHALWRSIVLVLLGIFLRSLGHAQTNFTFEDTLTQIGLGYFVLFVVSLLRSPATNGWCWCWCCWAIGWPLCCTRCRPPILTGRRSAYRPTGLITCRVLQRTGTRTRISRGPSIAGS